MNAMRLLASGGSFGTVRDQPYPYQVVTGFLPRFAPPERLSAGRTRGGCQVAVERTAGEPNRREGLRAWAWRWIHRE
jgi:hypothetical protein